MQPCEITAATATMTSSNAPALFGVLNIHKPSGMTSRDVVNRVQRLVRPLKCGHAGTLDPMATGVLLVCVGHATRLTDILHLLPKSYEAGFTLGQTSDTDDSTGRLNRSEPAGALPSASAVQEALAGFTGRIVQTPPQYSAVHVDGRRAYKVAREGGEVAIPPREVQVHAVDLLRYEWPVMDVRISCSSGTYIRSLARDLGNRLGCGGLMHQLVRTAIGPYTLANAVLLEQLPSGDSVAAHLLPAASIVSHLPAYDLSADSLAAVRLGKAIRPGDDSVKYRPPLFCENLADGPPRFPFCALMAGEFSQLVGLAERIATASGDQLQPRAVFL
jgi:tRNA pseudouridine55 synthase